MGEIADTICKYLLCDKYSIEEKQVEKEITELIKREIISGDVESVINECLKNLAKLK